MIVAVNGTECRERKNRSEDIAWISVLAESRRKLSGSPDVPAVRRDSFGCSGASLVTRSSKCSRISARVRMGLSSNRPPQGMVRA
jgi:hypothetical protein